MIATAAGHLIRFGTLALAGLCLGTSPAAFAAGYGQLEVPAASGEPAIQAMVWTPCASAANEVPLGPYLVQGTANCAIKGNALPLIVISHGQGGSLLGHHDTATALADAGFVVVSFNHPGDSYGDESAAQHLGVFESRPRDASRVITFMLAHWPLREHLDGQSIGAFGFSRGGYTALVLAGAVPNVPATATRLCDGWRARLTPLCRQIRSEDARLAPVADSRIRAAVVVDPLNLFDAAGLQPVRVPVQLWSSELGGDGVQLAHVEAIGSALPQAPEYHVAQGAGHFAYLAPCPPAFKASAPRICKDPKGFDRAAWHQRMNAAVVAFFQRHLHSDRADDPAAAR